ncbi:hypothetical protein ACFOFO_26155, partial [Undibacterium arcticum]
FLLHCFIFLPCHPASVLLFQAAHRCAGRLHRALFPPLLNGSRTISKVAEDWQAIIEKTSPICRATVGSGVMPHLKQAGWYGG